MGQDSAGKIEQGKDDFLPSRRWKTLSPHEEKNHRAKVVVAIDGQIRSGGTKSSHIYASRRYFKYTKVAEKVATHICRQFVVIKLQAMVP